MEQVEDSEHVKKLKRRSLRLEHSLVALWDHLRDLARDPTWYHNFLSTLHDEWKVEILSAFKLMNEGDFNAGDDELVVLGQDCTFDQITQNAESARSQYQDPVAALIRMTAPDRHLNHAETP